MVQFHQHKEDEAKNFSVFLFLFQARTFSLATELVVCFLRLHGLKTRRKLNPMTISRQLLSSFFALSFSLALLSSLTLFYGKAMANEICRGERVLFARKTGMKILRRIIAIAIFRTSEVFLCTANESREAFRFSDLCFCALLEYSEGDRDMRFDPPSTIQSDLSSSAD